MPSPLNFDAPFVRGLALACLALTGACGRDDARHEPPPRPVMTTPSTFKAPLPLEEAAAYPLPGLVGPQSITFTPDGSALAYLRSPERTLVRQLYRRDLKTGEESLLVAPPGGGATEANLSLEEKLRRERSRQRELGVTSYAWAEDGDTMLVPLIGKIYVKRPADSELRLLVDPGPGAPPALDAKLSPDGERVAYVHDDELYVVDVAGGQPKQLTRGARGTGKTNGLAEYIAQEEMHRSHGFWWSDDGQQLAFVEVDETHIPVYRIVHQGKDQVGDGAQEDHRYPFAGSPNARVRLGVVPVAGGRVTWMDLGEFEYLARVKWFPDGSLSAQLQDRSQQHHRFVRLDPRTGKRTLLVEETAAPWYNLHDDLRPLEKGAGELAGAFLWSSERTGFRQLELRAGDGRLIRDLTSGTWPIDHVVTVDEERGRVYFTGWRERPTEQHLFMVPLAGGDVVQLTQEPGVHGVVVDRAKRRFVDVHSSVRHPTRLSLRSLDDGALIEELPTEDDPRLASLDLPPPELVSFRNRHGDELWAAVYRPDPSAIRADARGAPVPAGPPYPTLVAVYGGPHAQRVVDTWGTTVDMRAQALRSRGYLVIKIDNRGSARRGLAFEGAIHRDLGRVELEDQVDGVRHFTNLGLVDPARVGIYGWSYGGYLSAMAMVRHPDVFRLAVAGAPVTHWDGYDTHYTERYMGTPADNPEGYRESSVMAHAGELRGALMLVHGLIDENVHFRHTSRLIGALIRARKPYELLLFPDERHMPRGLEDRVHMEEQILAFLQKHLG
ncbi:DPP IV N-terminal domain-containing protein [Nannocystis sp. ILAH1]|uniref:S9 family peptidase n=1 Tax=unclassified Nannocystis TaxID=2627009 RepID=UPI00226FED6A|nr:DPP IV N-terminal domain-containing protein [Nannocystis sp. ILAH1]MCY1070340.1 DPP IV N-terminal domain-containing protein [Nannocystis sp. RBIL2]